MEHPVPISPWIKSPTPKRRNNILHITEQSIYACVNWSAMSSYAILASFVYMHCVFYVGHRTERSASCCI